MELFEYLDASPSPWHAATNAAAWLNDAGFVPVETTGDWADLPAAGLVRQGGALIAWRRPALELREVRIVGAHTDSPGLRVHPHPDLGLRNWHSLGVEVYGGALLNSWLDRDLGVAGRVIDVDGTEHHVAVREPLARVPQLAIHLDRAVNDGLVLDKHVHLRPVWSTHAEPTFEDWLAARIGAVPAFWELGLFDVQPATRLGADRSLIASGRLDNQLSCWAAVTALANATAGDHQLAVVALFDHEEVGSESTTGAAGPLLETTIRRLLAASGVDHVDHVARVLAASSCVSADNAHALHPTYPERHDFEHAPLVNHGPAIKVNANQRYATDAATAALFARAAAHAGTPTQTFVSRNNVPCGSTIGPITATRLGISTVDVGIPQLSMHSARELCGADDPGYLAAALRSYFELD